jgi:hypothetical protein
VEKGSGEQAKAFNFSFEGGLSDFERLQRGVDEVICKILWDKEGNKEADGSKKVEKQAI